MGVKILLSFFYTLIFTLFASLAAYANTAHNDAQLILKPNASFATAGESWRVPIYVDTAASQVNAIQVNLSYPVDKMEVLSIDTSDSAFAVQAENKFGQGSIKIARGSITPISGETKVATVVFQIRSQTNIKDVTLAPGTAVITSQDNANIFQGVLRVQSPQSQSMQDGEKPSNQAPPQNLQSFQNTTSPKKRSFFEMLALFNVSIWEKIFSFFALLKEAFR